MEKKKGRVPCLCRVFFPSTCPSSRENLEENSAFDRTKALLKIPTKMILREMRCLSWICRPAMHRYLHRYPCMDLRNGKICYTTIIHTNFPSLTAKQLLKTSKNYWSSMIFPWLFPLCTRIFPRRTNLQLVFREESDLVHQKSAPLPCFPNSMKTSSRCRVLVKQLPWNSSSSPKHQESEKLFDTPIAKGSPKNM